MDIQFTCAIIKSQAIHRGQMGEIMKRTVVAGYTIARAQLTTLTKTQIRTFYAEHLLKSFWKDLERSVSHAVVIMALEGYEVVKNWRDTIGPTNPADCKEYHMRFLARDAALHCLADNALHGSATVDDADRELGLLFGAGWAHANALQREM